MAGCDSSVTTGDKHGYALYSAGLTIKDMSHEIRQATFYPAGTLHVHQSPDRGKAPALLWHRFSLTPPFEWVPWIINV